MMLDPVLLPHCITTDSCSQTVYNSFCFIKPNLPEQIVWIVSWEAHAPLRMWLFQLGLNQMPQWRRHTTCCCTGVLSQAVGAQSGELIDKYISLVSGSLPETQNPSTGSCPLPIYVLKIILSFHCSCILCDFFVFQALHTFNIQKVFSSYPDCNWLFGWNFSWVFLACPLKCAPS